MGKVLNLRSLDNKASFNTRLDRYIDGDGYESVMRWIPPFRVCFALTSVCAPATPSNTVGDVFHPSDIPSGAVLDTDYNVVSMGGYWADQYLCSSPDASSASMGTVANGTTVKAYVSQPGVAARYADHRALQDLFGCTICHRRLCRARDCHRLGWEGWVDDQSALARDLVLDAHQPVVLARQY